MPGKHAPPSPASFLLSLGRAGAGALAAIGLVVVIVVIAVGSRGDGPSLATSPTPTPTTTAEPTVEATEEPSPEPTQREPMIKRKRLSIEVLNGTNRTGLAASVEDKLEPAGYRRIEVDNAPEPASKTTIFFRGSLRREANRLLREFPELQRIRSARSSTPGEAQITIVLGDDYED